MFFVVAALVQKARGPPHYDLTFTAKTRSYLTEDLGISSSIDHYLENKHKNVPFYILFYLILQDKMCAVKIIQNYIFTVNCFIIKLLIREVCFFLIFYNPFFDTVFRDGIGTTSSRML